MYDGWIYGWVDGSCMDGEFMENGWVDSGWRMNE